ncbi:hypothetical protein B0H16DRAFT_1823389 [Mycena metata]|uniref:Uncharacterized protein n=1 Tax=Mycena metata TaxID=1033252 RepID=A0AAD7GZ11_9AGAR|nr:hypothetical protein B0H16DRAFT_1823389 [Mycena metata]
MAYLQVNGTAVLTANTQEHHRTALSERFLGTLARTHPTRLLITTFVPGFQLPSVYLECDVIADAQYDIIVGVEWATYICEGTSPLHATITRAASPHTSPTGVHSGPRISQHDHTPRDALEIGRLASQVTLDHLPRCGHFVSHVFDDTFLHFVPTTVEHPIPGPSNTADSSVPAPSKRKQPARSHPLLTQRESRGIDAIERLLLSPSRNANIFTMDQENRTCLMGFHHIPSTPDLTLPESRNIMLLHLLTGFCIDSCDPVSSNQHACHCRTFCSVFPNSCDMVFEVLSVLLSASEEKLPDHRAIFVLRCLGLTDDTRLRFLLQLSLMCRKLLQEYSVSDTLDELFNRLEKLPKPSLLVLAQSHRLKTVKVETSKQLRASICHHVALGSYLFSALYAREENS